MKFSVGDIVYLKKDRKQIFIIDEFAGESSGFKLYELVSLVNKYHKILCDEMYITQNCARFLLRDYMQGKNINDIVYNLRKINGLNFKLRNENNYNLSLYYDFSDEAYFKDSFDSKILREFDVMEIYIIFPIKGEFKTTVIWQRSPSYDQVDVVNPNNYLTKK